MDDSSSDSSRIISEDVFGEKHRTIFALRWLDWLFLVTAFCSILAVIGLTIERIVEYAKSQQGADLTFAFVLLINSVFCLYYVCSGLFRERLFEIYAYCIGVLVVAAYCVIEFSINSERRNDSKLARMVIACVLAPANLLLAYFVVRSFGWLEFRVVGASEALQKMFRQRNLTFGLLIFDLQAAVSFLVLSLTHGPKIHSAELVLSSVGIPFSLIWSFFIWLSIKKERVKWIIFVALFSPVLPGYVLFQVIHIGEVEGVHDFRIVATFVSAGIFILARLILLFEMRLAVKNFGHGLRENVLNFHSAANEFHVIRDLCCSC